MRRPGLELDDLGADSPFRQESGSAAAESRELGHGAEREQTRRLFERFAAASPSEQRAIREQVVTQHLALAASAARRYAAPGQYEDLVQVACCGLLEAFDRYDPTRSAFAAFAWITMTGLIRRHLRDHGWSVRPPRAVQEAANVLRRSWPELAQEVGRTPTTLDVAVHLGWTSDAVHAARTAELALHVASTDALIDAGALDASRVAEQPTEWHEVETRLLLERALQNLTDEERDLLRMRFVEEMTQTQIAALTGSKQMQVSRRLSRLMTKLRATIGRPDESDAVQQRPRTFPAGRRESRAGWRS